MAYQFHQSQWNGHGSCHQTVWAGKDHRTLHVPGIAEMKEPENIGYKPGELTYQFAGLNHFHWHKVTNHKGEDVTHQILKHINEKNGGTPVNIYQAPFPTELLDTMGLIPCGYHRYYYLQDEMLEHSLHEFSEGGTCYSDAACECISAIYNNKQLRMTVSTQNNGAISFLPSDCIVEVKETVNVFWTNCL